MVRSRPLLALSLLLIPPALSAPLAAARVVHKVGGDAVAGSDVVQPEVVGARVSPDGEWIVWIQDAEDNETFALWAARRWGGPRKRISGLLPEGAAFTEVVFTPDSRRVIYRADQDTVGRDELYSVPLLGTAADVVKLSPTPGAQGGVADFDFSADGTRAVILMDGQAVGGHCLHAVPVDGSAPAVGFDGPYDDSNGRVGTYRLAGGRVLFHRRKTGSGPYSLWSAPLTGSAASAVRLSPDFATGGVAVGVALSPDLTRVAFRASQGEGHHLWIADVAGAQESAEILVPAFNVLREVQSTIQFAAGGSRVVFTGDLDVEGMTELYAVPADGSAERIQLSVGLPSNGDVDGVGACPTGNAVLYTADWEDDEQLELFSVPADATSSAASERRSRALAASESVRALLCDEESPFYAIYGEGGQIVEVRGLDPEGPVSAEWTVTGLAETAFRLPTALRPGIGERIVFTADLDAPGDFEIWATRFDGTMTPEELQNPLWSEFTLPEVNGGMTPDEAEVFFLAAYNDGPLQLWGTRADGSQTYPLRINPVPVPNGAVAAQIPEVTADGAGVLFVGDLETASRDELFLADALVFKADFDEEGNLSEWTVAVP